MIIRAIGKKVEKVKQAVRRFATTPTSCKGCRAVRNATGKVIGVKQSQPMRHPRLQ